MQVENALLFHFVYRRLIDVWVQVIVPPILKSLDWVRGDSVGLPFTALFASASAYFEFFLQFVRHKGPFARPVLLHELYYGIVLLKCNINDRYRIVCFIVRQGIEKLGQKK